MYRHCFLVIRNAPPPWHGFQYKTYDRGVPTNINIVKYRIYIYIHICIRVEICARHCIFPVGHTGRIKKTYNKNNNYYFICPAVTGYFFCTDRKPSIRTRRHDTCNYLMDLSLSEDDARVRARACVSVREKKIASLQSKPAFVDSARLSETHFSILKRIRYGSVSRTFFGRLLRPP